MSHLDNQRVDELRDRYLSGANGPLELPGETLLLDTATETVDELVERLLPQLANPPAATDAPQ